MTCTTKPENSSIFVDDNQYQDFSEKVQAAVYSNSLMGKIKLENNTEKVYFLDDFTFNSKFYHKHFGLEDNFDGAQKQKSANYLTVSANRYHCSA